MKTDLSKLHSSDLKGTWQLECSGNSREATFERATAVFWSKDKDLDSLDHGRFGD